MIRYEDSTDLWNQLKDLLPTSPAGFDQAYWMKTISILSNDDKELKSQIDTIIKENKADFDNFRVQFNKVWADIKAQMSTRGTYVDTKFQHLAQIIDQMEAAQKGKTQSIPETMKTHAVYSWDLSEDPSGMTYATNLKYSTKWLVRYFIQHKDANGKVIVLPNGDNDEVNHDGFSVSDPNIRWFRETDGTLGYESKNPDIGKLQIWATDSTPTK